MRALVVFPLVLLVVVTSALAQPTTLPAKDGVGRFPGVEVDVKRGQVRVECQALHVEAPLEFFCCSTGTNEHESVLRTSARPSNIHAGLLMLGLEPGEPVRFSPAAKKWLPPHGPPLSISVEFQKDGKTITLPAYKLMRSTRTKQSMPPTTWIFAGSRVMEDGNYAADVTGYIVSIVNFDLTMIDIPELASSANETLQWETNLEAMPERGATVTMILSPVRDGGGGAPDASHEAPSTRPTTRHANLSDITIDQAKIDRLRERWNAQVKPHDAAMREAAQAQYEVLAGLRREQQRLIDEADRIQRLIDELEQQYQQMTTPRPEPAGSK
jgi:hypothetical protein